MSISYLNSLTPRNVVSGFVFNGVYDDILSTSQITTRITANVNTDNHYTLLIEYSNDKVNVISFETTTVIFDYNKLLYLTPTSRYFKLTLTAISDINDLSIETIFKHAIVYQLVNQISGNVIVDNMPATQTILNGSIDLLNSSTNPLLIGESFVGTYVSSLLLSEINVSFEADGVCDLNIQYSLDGFNLGLSNPRVVGEIAVPYFINLPPLMNYYRISLSNVVSNMTYLRLSTTPRNTISYKGNTISGDVSVNNFPATQAVSGPLTDAQLRLADVAVSGPLTDAQLRLTDVPVSGPLTDAQLRLTAVPVSIALPLDTHITAIDSALTFLTQERPTTETYFTTSAGNLGIWISGLPKVIRNMSINTNSSVIVYVYLYDLASIPTNLDTPTFVFTVKDSNNVVFNPLDHKFVNGLGLRATTTYNGVISPALNSVFVNMTLSD